MMDIFGKRPAATPQQRNHLGQRSMEWPTTRAQRGKYYKLPDPIHTGDMLCVMTIDTFADFGSQLEISRRAGLKMDERIKELISENQILAAKAAQYKDKLEHVQSVRRKEQIAKAYKSHGVTHDAG